MTESGTYASYNGNIFKLTSDMDDNVIIITEDKENTDASFEDKYNTGVFSKVVDISDLDEIYKIVTYGKVHEERISIIKEKQGEYLVSTSDCKIGEKLKLERVDKYCYEGWLPSSVVQVYEERHIIKPSGWKIEEQNKKKDKLTFLYKAHVIEKKNIRIILGALCSVLILAILIPVMYFFVLTETIIIDAMPAPDIQEQIDIYAELGYCMSGYDNGEDVVIRLTHKQRQRWLQDVQEEIDEFLIEANELENTKFEISDNYSELTLITNKNFSVRSVASHTLLFVYDMQLVQVLSGDENFNIDFTLKDIDTNEILYTAVLPEERVRIGAEIWEQ